MTRLKPGQDERRPGDDRAILQEHGLTWWPAHNYPIRWLPRHGEPLCVLEWTSQLLVKLAAWLPIYTAIGTTLTLILVILRKG